MKIQIKADTITVIFSLMKMKLYMTQKKLKFWLFDLTAKQHLYQKLFCMYLVSFLGSTGNSIISVTLILAKAFTTRSNDKEKKRREMHVR